jgi:integrase
MPLTDAKFHLTFPVRRMALDGRDFPYWWVFGRGRSLGYHKGLTVASWFARVRLKVGRYRQTRLGEADDMFPADGLTVLSFDQARQKAEEWCEMHANEASPRYLDHENHPVYPDLPPSPPYTVAHAMVDYMKWYRENRSGFARIYYDSRSYVLPRFGHLPVDQLTTQMIREWIDELAETPAKVRVRRGEPTQYKVKKDDPEDRRRRRNTVNRTLAITKAAFNRAYEYGYVDSDLAWKRVKKFLRVEPTSPRYLEKEDCQKLIAACQPELRRFVVGALLSGCRVGELRSMRTADYLAALKRLLIRNAKGGRVRHISLSDQGAAFFAGLAKDRPANELMFVRANGRGWRPSSHHRPFHKATFKAGLPQNVAFHHLRHTYAAHAAMAGIPLQVIARQLGHADTRLVERLYAYVGSSYLDEVIRTKMPKLVTLDAI